MSSLYRIKDPVTGHYHSGSTTYDPSTRTGKVYSSTGLKAALSYGFVVHDDWNEGRVLGSGALVLARLVVEEVGTGNTWPLAEWRESAG